RRPHVLQHRAPDQLLQDLVFRDLLERLQGRGQRRWCNGWRCPVRTGPFTAPEDMATYTAADGERFRITPNLLIVPPTLRSAAEYILKNQFSGPNTWQTFGPSVTQVGASDNMFRRMGVDYMVEPNLLNNTNWYLADTTHSVKPVRWIQREG